MRTNNLSDELLAPIVVTSASNDAHFFEGNYVTNEHFSRWASNQSLSLAGLSMRSTESYKGNWKLNQRDSEFFFVRGKWGYRSKISKIYAWISIETSSGLVFHQVQL